MSKTILVIDDDPEIGAYLRQVLTTEGFHVTVGERAVEAVNLFERLQPDVLLLDINMPGSDGFFALKRIRMRSQSGVIIMISAREGVDDIQEALDHGADDYIVKPIDRGTLVRKIQKHLKM